MTRSPDFPKYRQEVADAMLAELDIHEELLTPLRTAHVGAVAAGDVDADHQDPR